MVISRQTKWTDRWWCTYPLRYPITRYYWWLYIPTLTPIVLIVWYLHIFPHFFLAVLRKKMKSVTFWYLCKYRSFSTNIGLLSKRIDSIRGSYWTQRQRYNHGRVHGALREWWQGHNLTAGSRNRMLWGYIKSRKYVYLREKLCSWWKNKKRIIFIIVVMLHNHCATKTLYITDVIVHSNFKKT